jgi:t-SNARE complex subunit (syntaxin)
MFPDLGASRRRGITVLTLLLIIIAVIVAAVFLVRYLRNRPAVSHTRPAITASTA